jgi:hypothetical protein
MPKVFGSTTTGSAGAAACTAGFAAFLQPDWDITIAPKAPAADTLRNSLLDCDFFIVLVLNNYEVIGCCSLSEIR